MGVGYGVELVAQSLGALGQSPCNEEDKLRVLRTFAGPNYDPDHLVRTNDDEPSILDSNPQTVEQWAAYIVTAVESGGMPWSSACKLFFEIAEENMRRDTVSASNLLNVAEKIVSGKEYKTLESICNCPKQTSLLKRVRAGISARFFGKAENSTTPISH